MLDILPVLFNQSLTEACKLLPQLWHNLGTDEVLDRRLASCVRVDIYVELEMDQFGRETRPRGRGDIQHTRLLQCRGRSPGQ